MYESEHTRFMRRYLEEHPEEVASQKEGRAIWWDKTPERRTAPQTAASTPRAGGNEHTFQPFAEGKD